MRTTIIAFASLLSLFLAAVPSARAQLQVNIDGYPIVDGSADDLDLSPGVIRFNSLIQPTVQQAVRNGYIVQGKAERFSGGGGGAVLNSILPGSAGARLTDFVAERVVTSTGGQLQVSLWDNLLTGPFNGVYQTADVVDAQIGNSLGAAVPAGAAPISAAGFVNSSAGFDQFAMSPPFGNNPALPAASGPLSYPLLTATHSTPALNNSGYLTVGSFLSIFDLPGLGDQFILPSSMEFGYLQVPEPGSAVLFVCGGLLVLCQRRRSRLRCNAPATVNC